jgi:hypothetical protein
MTSTQGFMHGIKYCGHRHLRVLLSQLTKPSGQFSNKIGAVHLCVNGFGSRLNSSIADCMG